MSMIKLYVRLYTPVNQNDHTSSSFLTLYRDGPSHKEAQKGEADYFCRFRAEPEKRIFKTGIAPVASHHISDFSWWSIKLLQPYVHEMESLGSRFKINLRSRVTPNMSKSRERRGASKALSHKRTHILITGFWDLWLMTMLASCWYAKVNTWHFRVCVGYV